MEVKMNTKNIILKATIITAVFLITLVPLLNVNAEIVNLEVYEYPHDNIQEVRDGCMALNGLDYLVAGRTWPWQSYKQPFMLKIDSQAQEQWYIEYERVSSYDAAWCISPLIDSGYVLGGKTESLDKSDNILVFKTDSLGERLWIQDHDIGEGFDRMWDILELDDGTLIGCGTITEETRNDKDAGLIKMNSEGARLWHKSYGSSNTHEVARTFYKTSDEEFIIGGYYGWSGSGNDMTNQSYVIKTDPEGNEEWSFIHGNTTVWNSALWITETPDNCYLIAGRTGIVTGGTNGWVLKLSNSGDSIIWETIIGGEHDDWFLDGYLTIDGGCILVGLTESFSTDPSNDENSRDGWIVKLNADGNILWQQTVGNPGKADQLADIARAGDGRYFCGGTTGNRSGGVWTAANCYLVIFEAPPIYNSNTNECFSTIQAAIDDPDTQDGHTIYVDRGMYQENIEITKSISLVGEDRDTTIIDGNHAGDVVYISAAGVCLTGFTIKNCGPSFDVGIDIRSNSNQIYGNKIIDNSNNQGIYLKSSSNNHIYSNVFSNNKFGIWLWYSSNNNIIHNNTIMNSDYEGILILDHSCNNLIYSNDFYNNGYVGTDQAYDECTLLYGPQYTNTWYDALMSNGNYWCDYPEEYPDATNNGIVWDTPYEFEGNEDPYPLVFPATIKCGDANEDGNINILDVNYIIAYLYKGGPEPVPVECVADADGNGNINILDTTFLINYLYKGGPAPSGCCCDCQ
jgi:parallel beta-helix repeat protein